MLCLKSNLIFIYYITVQSHIITVTFLKTANFDQFINELLIDCPQHPKFKKGEKQYKKNMDNNCCDNNEPKNLA